jgi:hypothetical protein
MDGTIKENEHLLKIFNQKTYNWKIVHARTLYLTEFMEEMTNNFAQITMSYIGEDKKQHYIVFEREITQNFCFYNWKIFLAKYEYFGQI